MASRKKTIILSIQTYWKQEQKSQLNIDLKHVCHISAFQLTVKHSFYTRCCLALLITFTCITLLLTTCPPDRVAFCHDKCSLVTILAFTESVISPDFIPTEQPLKLFNFTSKENTYSYFYVKLCTKLTLFASMPDRLQLTAPHPQIMYSFSSWSFFSL